MDGRRKPDPQPGNENELNDEQVIDLTRIVEGGDDGDVVDLTEILEEPDQALDPVVELEEAVNPDVEALPKETSAGVPADTDEEIIDLTETTSAPITPAAETEAGTTPAPSGDEVDEAVIDLMDVATTPETDLDEAEPDVPAIMAEESVETPTDEDDVIDLLDVTAPPVADSAETDLQDSASVPEETAEVPDDADDEIIDLTEVTSVPQTADVEPAVETGPVSGENEIDEAVIDLIDVAAPSEADSVDLGPEGTATISQDAIETTEDEGDVIDLQDAATTPATDIAETDLQDAADGSEEAAGTTQEDQPIIDLLDAVEPQTAQAETTAATDDEFSDLESRAEAVLTDTVDAVDLATPDEAAETAGPDSDFMVFENDEAMIVEDETPAIADDEPETSPDIPEADTAPLFVPVSPPEPIPLTESQVEAALERTIEKIYGEKIEQLLIRTIEKTVTREIVRIKNALLEDDDDMVG